MTATLELTCQGVTATQAVAGAVALIVLPGDVILLDGDLGAGKTTWTQGLARALGVDDVVTSPTFTLMRGYPTHVGVELLHVDVYRLDDEREIVDLGLAELLDDGAVAVIEWGDKAVATLPPDYLRLRFALTDVDGERRVTVSATGPRWEAGWAELESALRALAPAGPTS